jgi:predicted anti-sigma-YlaC factor YlaD
MLRNRTADAEGMKIGAHLSPDLLELHILDRLTEFENDSVEEHLLVCSKCNVLRKAVEEQIQLIRMALATSRCKIALCGS